MAKKQYIHRHLLIINRLKAKPATFLEIQGYLMKQQEILEEDFEISKRTFQRDLKEILSIYEIEIQYNKKEGWYEILDDDMEKPFERIIEAVETINAISLSNAVSNKLLLEKKRASGSEHLHGLLHAIENKLVIQFEHQSYWKEGSTKRTVEPIAIKEAQHRWYLICFDVAKNEIRNFGLDRIFNLEITLNKFLPKMINVNQLYENAFGIETYEPAEKVILKFDESQAVYLKSLPIHHSQKILEETPNAFKIELFVHPTFDFVIEILKYGELVEVLEPLKLRETIKWRIERANQMYQ